MQPFVPVSQAVRVYRLTLPSKPHRRRTAIVSSPEAWRA